MAEAGGYDLEFLEEPKEDYECPICQLVMKEPQIVDCCGYKYCFGCVNRVMLANKPCPMCLNNAFNLMPEKQLQRKIKDLKVKCPQKKLGCTWEGEIRALDGHTKTSCLYVEVNCPLECGGLYQRAMLQKHQEDDCPKRTAEHKFISLTRKIETRLTDLEAKCSQQGEEIISLKEELEKMKTEKEEQEEKVKQLQSQLEDSSCTHQTQLEQSLRVIEREIIQRCFSLSLRVTLVDNWISPPFYSHQNGYILQLSAKLHKFTSALDSLTYSLFSSGRNPEKGPVHLYLEILPQSQTENNLEWPIHVSVDILVLTNTDTDSNAKMYTLTKYKSTALQQKMERSRSADEYTDGSSVIIGHARFCFTSRLLILNIRYSTDTPLAEIDTRSAVDDGKV